MTPAPTGTCLRDSQAASQVAPAPSGPSQALAQTSAGEPPHLPELLIQLAPSSLGLAIARVACLTLSFGSYRSTDDGLMTDSTVLIAILLLATPLALLQNPMRHLKKRTLWVTMRASVIGQAAMLLAYATVLLCDLDIPALSYAISVGAVLCFAGTSFHWIRRARGANSDVAAVFVFGALAISEAILYLLFLVPESLSCMVAAALTLAQFPCLATARTRTLLADLRLGNHTDGFFGDETRMAITSRRFLATSALGMVLMGIAVGILRGYPFGSPIHFDVLTRLAYALVTIGICLAICRMTTRKSATSPMTTTIWVIMQLLGAVALVLYAVLPEHLAIGAIFTNTLNSLLIAYMWYATIAFLSCGPNDAFYYCIGGWAAFLFPRALMRVASIVLVATNLGISVTVAVVGMLLLLCAQAVFLQLYGMRNAEPQTSDSLGHPLDSLLGLSTMPTPTEMRDAAVRQQVDEIRERFQLSDREAEVLALYVQGETQNKIAEALGITANTAHAHIKHIYAKCDLHSRQELLDFLREYERI